MISKINRFLYFPGWSVHNMGVFVFLCSDLLVHAIYMCVYGPNANK